MLKTSLLALAACCAALPLSAQTLGFYRQPALAGEQMVFVAEGDLWRAPLSGGTAQRLTTHAGSESWPALSPDGRWLAFVAQYDGAAGSNGDVYVMPPGGGLPRRLSWDSAALRVWGITPAGEVLYTGPTERGEPGTQLYAAQIETGRRRALPVGQASDGALSADGRILYFTRNGLRGDNARQYRGGAIARLWVLDLTGTAEARPLLAEGHNDRRPMPYRDASGAERIAFLSDRDGTVNLWSVDAQGQDLRQHSRHRGWDIRHASIAGSQVVYALGADLYRLELAGDAAPQRLALALAGDAEQQRQRWIAKPQDFLTHTAFAPDGERVLLASRGRLATQGTGALRRAELQPPAALADSGRCHAGEFSGDSRSVIALCDYSGELELWRFPADGLSPPQALTQGATAPRQALAPSPDGRWVAHADKEGRLFLTDLQARDAAAATREIDRDPMGGIQDLRWSADGRALAYVRNTSTPWREQLMLHVLAEGRSLQLSSDRYASAAPSFSPDGRWLYFLSRRHFAVGNPAAPWGDRNMGPAFERGWRVYALALQPGLRAPFAPPDELAAEPARAEGGKAEARPTLVTAGLAQRLYELPLPPGHYRELRVAAKRLWWLEGDGDGASLRTAAIEPEPKVETVAEKVQQFELSADGKKLMVRRAAAAPGAAPEILIVEAAPKLPAELDRARVRWSDWRIATEPRAEWRQMFADAWRMQRDHFYDRDMHGVDWSAMRAKYAPLVERVTERGELSELLAQLAAELGALHSQVVASDLRRGAEEPGLAGLGARLERAEGPVAGWRIAHLYRGDPELPAEAAPLAAPGLDIPEGSVITAINGRAAAAAPHPAELLRGQAGRQVLLQLREPGGRERRVLVLPVDARREAQLRLNDWRWSRASLVQAASQGRIGYLHLRAMGREDIADFAREFYAQVDREGLIIDLRHNGGGNIDSWILEKLLRRAWAFWQPRSPAGAPAYSNMQQTFRGQVVVLVNEETYSDGETFAEGFKRLGLGPVIGTTTSGAGVWLSDRNRLLDNGLMRAAESAQILADGRFIIEGKGVAPDVLVDNLPRATADGRDAQLEAAVAWLSKAMAQRPLVQPRPGPYPRPFSQP